MRLLNLIGFVSCMLAVGHVRTGRHEPLHRCHLSQKELMFSLACKAAIVQVTFWHSSLPVMWEIATGWRR